jgi:hypothetical protein
LVAEVLAATAGSVHSLTRRPDTVPAGIHSPPCDAKITIAAIFSHIEAAQPEMAGVVAIVLSSLLSICTRVPAEPKRGCQGYASPILFFILVGVFVFVLVFIVVDVLVFVLILVLVFILVGVFVLVVLLFVVELFVEQFAGAIAWLLAAAGANVVLYGSAALNTRGASA